jgi:hypothetical protein
MLVCKFACGLSSPPPTQAPPRRCHLLRLRGSAKLVPFSKKFEILKSSRPKKNRTRQLPAFPLSWILRPSHLVGVPFSLSRSQVSLSRARELGLHPGFPPWALLYISHFYSKGVLAAGTTEKRKLSNPPFNRKISKPSVRVLRLFPCERPPLFFYFCVILAFFYWAVVKDEASPICYFKRTPWQPAFKAALRTGT